MSLTKVSFSMIQGAWANVLDFGAKGDGSTNDTVAFQNAIDSLPEYGTLYIPVPSSTYELDTVTIATKGITVTGQGKCHMKTSSTSLFQVTAGTTDVSFDGLVLDGTGSDFFDTAHYGQGLIRVGTSSSGATDNVVVQNCTITNGPIAMWAPHFALIMINKITNGKIHVLAEPSSAAPCIGNNIQGNSVYTPTVISANGGAAIQVDDMKGNGTNNIIADNVIWTNLAGISLFSPDGFGLNADAHTKITGNSIQIITADSSFPFGITCVASERIIVANNSVNIDQQVANSLGLEINYPGKYVVTGNTFQNAAKGVICDGGDAVKSCDNVLITGNYFYHCATGVSIFRNCKNITVADNQFEIDGNFSPYRAISMDSISGQVPTNISVTGNNIYFDAGAVAGLTPTFILLLSAQQTTIANNQLRWKGAASGTRGVYLGAGDSVSVLGNMFTSIDSTIGYAISYDATVGRYCKIRNNTIDNTEEAVSLAGAAPLYSIEIGANTTINNASAGASGNSIFDQYINGAKVAYAGAQPAKGSWPLGSIIFNNTGSTGWKCTTAGTQGTLTGTTGSITSGTTALTLNTSVGIEVGAYITIAGVTGTKRVTALNTTTNVATISSNADATVSGAAVAFSAAAFTGMAI